MSSKAGQRGSKVSVWGRIRPTASFAQDNLELLPDGKSVNVHMEKDPRKGVVNNQIMDWSFKLDGIFHNSNQEQVYGTLASDIVTSTLDGYNGTLMCYGQTGAGKTFTMTGATESYKHRGLIPRSLSQLFRDIEDRPEHSITVRISYMEIYNETMYDLLSTLPDSKVANEPMVVTENNDGVFVKGLSCHLAQNEEDALNLLFEGETNRAISSHSLNKQSSRSHCLFTVYLESRSRVQSDARYTVSKLNFVDLAGSERLSKTKSEGKTQTEAMYINKSLSFLEQVIVALADKRREHVPFRQSKLTHYLKDSIGGNCKTVMIANMWGECSQMEETVSTLRFATRMMCVSSEPAVNKVYDPALLCKKLQEEIHYLKSELAMHDTLANRSHIGYDALSEQQKYEIRHQVRRYLEGTVDEVDIVNIRQIQGTHEAFKEIHHQIEGEIEEKLRQKYTLIDKTDPAAVMAAQQAGLISEEASLVGESDGSGFGVGSAPRSVKAEPSAVVQLKKKEKERESKKKGMKDRQSRVFSAVIAAKAFSSGFPESPVAGKASTSPSPSAKGDRELKSPHTPIERKEDKDVDGTASPISSMSAAPNVKERPSTPPSRSTAFEEFKRERGSKINSILIENKEILASKKKAYTEKARLINANKIDIDNSRQKLDDLRLAREAEGVMFNEEGDVIISEEEFLTIKHLKELKQTYRTNFEDLKNLKTEVQYCQKLVDQCRQKLLQEFDNWYSESFLTANDETATSLAAGHGTRPGVLMAYNAQTVPEDEQEKFERLQHELLMNNPDSASFYNAQMRTQRRKTYSSAMSQPQPSFNRRQTGTPTMQIRNQPPTLLQVQY